MRWRQRMTTARLCQAISRITRSRHLTTTEEAIVRHDQDDELTEQFRYHSGRPMQPVHLERLMISARTPCPRSSVQFLREQIPTRLCHALTDLSLLPDLFRSTSSFKGLNRWYLDSFRDVSQFDGGTVDEAERFAVLANDILDRHRDVVPTLSEGLREMEKKCGENKMFVLRDSIQKHTDRFLLNRISMRFLLSQHCALVGDSRHGDGEIQRCNVFNIIQEAALTAKTLTRTYLAESPKVNIEVSSLSGNEINVPCVPSHIYVMMFEIIKNACRATVEHCRQQTDLPEISVKIEEEEDYVTVMVKDRGGGMEKSVFERLFHYNFSTANLEVPCHGVSDIVPLAGCGFGLKLSRLCARYWGGNLVVATDEGHGTSVAVSLKRCAGTEVLPPSLDLK